MTIPVVMSPGLIRSGRVATSSLVVGGLLVLQHLVGFLLLHCGLERVLRWRNILRERAERPRAVCSNGKCLLLVRTRSQAVSQCILVKVWWHYGAC